MTIATILVGILTLTLNIHPAKAARIIIVPDHYATIQLAVDAATSGDTIQVRPGEYIENVVIDGKSSISLIGEDTSTTIIRNKDYKTG